MPIFEFACCTCGKEFERLVFSSEEQPVTCPECGSGDTRKVLSVFTCSQSAKSLGGSSCGSHSHSGGTG